MTINKVYNIPESKLTETGQVSDTNMFVNIYQLTHTNVSVRISNILAQTFYFCVRFFVMRLERAAAVADEIPESLDDDSS